MLKPIPYFPHYFAENAGFIWSDKSGELRQLKGKTGGTNKYLFVILRRNGKGITRTVHSLILETFVSERPYGCVARHGPKGSICNARDNLSWGTPGQNEQDKRRDRTLPMGESHYNHRLNSLQVRIIQKAYGFHGKNGLTCPDLAEIFDVCRQTIHDIVRGRNWKHISR